MQTLKICAVCTRCFRFVNTNGFTVSKAHQVYVGRSQCASDAAIIRKYMGMLDKRLTKLNLLDRPDLIHNCAEKGWSKQQQMQQPVIPTESPQVK